MMKIQERPWKTAPWKGVFLKCNTNFSSTSATLTAIIKSVKQTKSMWSLCWNEIHVAFSWWCISWTLLYSHNYSQRHKFSSFGIFAASVVVKFLPVFAFSPMLLLCYHLLSVRVYIIVVTLFFSRVDAIAYRFTAAAITHLNCMHIYIHIRILHLWFYGRSTPSRSFTSSSYTVYPSKSFVMIRACDQSVQFSVCSINYFKISTKSC